MAQKIGPGELTLDQWVQVLRDAMVGLPGAIKDVAEVIGHNATENAKDKLGAYQGASGPFPAWVGLSPATIADKLSQGFPVPSPLLRTGAMRDGISYDIETKGPGDVVVTLQCDAPYADFHEFGTVKMPPRPFAGPAMYETVEAMAPQLAETVVTLFYPDGILSMAKMRRTKK